MNFISTAKSCAILLAVGLPCVTAQILADGVSTVMFGDELAAVAKRLDEKSYDVDRGRFGVDKLIGTTTVELVFDSDRLWRVTLKPTHPLRSPLKVFSEEWKNFGPIGERKLTPRMSRESFTAYFALWRQVTEAAGKRENVDFWVTETGSSTTGGRVTITFAPRRRLMGTGELIGDTWLFTFLGATNSIDSTGVAVASLNEMVVTCDRFSTLGRETAADRAVSPAPRFNGRALAGRGEVGGSLTLDDDRRVVLGVALSVAEQSLLEWSRDDPLPSARTGIDRWVVLPKVVLRFDADRLKGAAFDSTYEFKHPIRCFDADWKNPDPIDGVQVKRGLTRKDLEAYLAVWRKRAIGVGKREGADFWITDGDNADLVSVSLGPRRITADGHNYWSDRWSAKFETRGDGAGELAEFQVLLDAFNTVARPAPGARDPAWAGVTLEDGTELYFGQERTEVERLLGVTAGASPRSGGAFVPSNRTRISLRNVDVEFDNDRLILISFRKFSAIPAPFPEAWKNLTPIGELRVAPAMSREKFAEYLAAWEARLQSRGFVSDKNYIVTRIASAQFETVMIRLPASRVSVGGSNWPDTWSFSFMEAGPITNRRWELWRIDAVCGEYNSRPPSPAAQRRKSVQEIIKDALVIEPPPIELVLPKP